MTYTESDIKHEGKKFFVIWNKETKRYEICQIGCTHSTVIGWSDDLQRAISVCKKLEPDIAKTN